MNKDEEQLERLLTEKKILKLLKIDKKRRGVSENELVFIGMPDTAQYYWCAEKSFWMNKRMEPNFFAAYSSHIFQVDNPVKFIINN